MWRRLVFALILTLLPATSLADDASQLGPQSGAVGQGAASPQTLTILQPANGAASPLQSSNVSGSGVSQSDTSQAATLQQTGSGNDIKVLLQGEADTQHDVNDPVSLRWLYYILWVLGITTALTGVVWYFEQRRRTT